MTSAVGITSAFFCSNEGALGLDEVSLLLADHLAAEHGDSLVSIHAS